MIKVALCARYSSENQRDASIEDQLRLCRLHAEKQGWTVVDSYTDRAISGASLLRPGIQELISDAMRGKFVVVLAEAMDRLSRDQEDIAGDLGVGLSFGMHDDLVGISEFATADEEIDEVSSEVLANHRSLGFDHVVGMVHQVANVQTTAQGVVDSV